MLRVRPLEPADIPILQQIAEKSGYPYPDLTTVEAVCVVVDEDGHILTACAAKRLVEVYLYPINGPTMLKLRALRLVHKEMAKLLREKGYNCAEAFLPPEIARKFGRRLERSFSWVKNWNSWTKKF